ncbi:hypothetical protein [Streptomyces sp. x-19]|uniref:hypothetical protein n=1 Tax=Streptomyces sp. x-19 TaxID=2789280 RepID=UPI00397FD7ED
MTPMYRDDTPERRLTPPVYLGVPGPEPKPAPGCDICGALADQREEARKRGDMAKVSDCNVEMKRHPEHQEQ